MAWEACPAQGHDAFVRPYIRSDGLAAMLSVNVKARKAIGASKGKAMRVDVLVDKGRKSLLIKRGTQRAMTANGGVYVPDSIYQLNPAAFEDAERLPVDSTKAGQIVIKLGG